MQGNEFFEGEVHLDPVSNLVTQAVLLGIVLVSMVFRMKGKYLVHEITMIAVVAVTIIGTCVITATTPASESQILWSTPLHSAVVGTHMIVAIATLVFGVWLVALWRPHSTTFAAKSKRQAQITTILWILTFVVGVVVYVTLHTTLFA